MSAHVTAKLKQYLTDRDYRFLIHTIHGMTDKMGDEQFIQKLFHAKMGYDLDLRNPKTFNEKLQWLKLHDRKPIYTTMVDKYEAKKYVANIIGEEHIIPTLGVWERFEDIDFDVLPDQFVLKCTHDSGGLVIVKDKTNLDWEETRKKIEKCLQTDFYMAGREWPYKNVKPRIIAEPYMVDSNLSELRDYKFFCFCGNVRCFKVDYDRFTDHRANYYTPDGSQLHFGEKICLPDYEREITLPESLPSMVNLAEKLSSGFTFLRIDLYEVNGKVYFGEFTFYPASGFGQFVPEKWDAVLGEWLTLPDQIG